MKKKNPKLDVYIEIKNKGSKPLKISQLKRYMAMLALEELKPGYALTLKERLK